MIEKILKKIVLLTLCLGFTSVGYPDDRVLRVGVAPEDRRFFPGLLKRVLGALESSGYVIKLVELPRKRLRLMLMNGELAIQAGLGSKIAPKDPNIVRIDPPIVEINLYLATSSKTPELCEVNEAEFAEMSFVSVLGQKFAETFIAPRFAHSIWAKNYVDMLKLVSLGRADVTFVAKETVHLIPDELMDGLTICNTHHISNTIHSYMHSKYLWAKPEIDSAYAAEFGQN